MVSVVAVVLGFIEGLGAAALDPDRPLGPQPEVTGEVRDYFSGKKIQEMKFHVLDNVIIRVANVEKIKEEMEKRGGRAPADFRETFDVTATPLEDVAEGARMAASYLPAELRRREAVVEIPSCEGCLAMRLEYSKQTLLDTDGKKPYVQVRVAASVFLGGAEIARTRGGILTELQPPWFFEKNKTVWAQSFARQAVGDIMYVLNKRFGVEVPPEPTPPPKK